LYGEKHRKHEAAVPAYAFFAYACHGQAVGACRLFDELQIYDPEAYEAVGVFLLAEATMKTHAIALRARLVLRGPA
jgi:hypothetical protein